MKQFRYKLDEADATKKFAKQDTSYKLAPVGLKQQGMAASAV
jgi:hypothetical protein